MTNEEKIELIKANKSTIFAALNVYLDSIYDLTDEFFDEKGNRKSVLPQNIQAENFLKETYAGAQNYENVRAKLARDDFNLSTLEINYIALAFLYVVISLDKELTKLQDTYTNAKDLYNKLTSGEEKS